MPRIDTRLPVIAGLLFAASLAGGGATPAGAQVQAARSRDYLFAAGTDDARALWLNPAGLGPRPVASLFGEIANVRSPSGGWHVAQYSFALSSRNIAVGYKRDRVEAGPSAGHWRVGGGIGLPPLALGAGIEFHPGGRSWDVGLVYLPAPVLLLGAVVRNVGRPVVGDSALRLTGAASIAWHPVRNALVMAEAAATERRPLPGHDDVYRGGIQVFLPARWPITVLSAFDFRSASTGLRLDRWSIGLALGAANQLVGIGTVGRPAGNTGSQLEGYSVAGVSRALRR